MDQRKGRQNNNKMCKKVDSNAEQGMEMEPDEVERSYLFGSFLLLLKFEKTLLKWSGHFREKFALDWNVRKTTNAMLS